MIEINIKDKSYETGNIFKERWSEGIPAVIIYGYNFETKERKFYYHFSGYRDNFEFLDELKAAKKLRKGL